MIKKILFATDLGPFTPQALAHVEFLARHFDSQISLVHAVPPLSEFTSAIVKSYCSDNVKREVLKAQNIKGVIESVRDEVFDMVAANKLIEDDFLKRLAEIIILPGKPAPIILFEADRVQADMIVIGSHGADTIDSNLLGSVTSRVLQLSRIPVFMVPLADTKVLGQRDDDDTCYKLTGG